MYCDLFQLKEPPFRLTPDPQFLFASKQHARAKAYMESTIWLADGFVVITGEIGSGKTTLIESFLAEVPPEIVVAHISQTQLSPVEFLQAVLVEFGFRPFRKRKVELLAMLKDFLIEQYAAGKKLLLVIDEAQNLTPLEAKTIITRVGHGTKIVFTGDPYQIDNPYVDSSSNGFNYVVSRFRTEAISAHIELQKGERSELAELAANIL